jgi:hypothetical protein
MNKKNTIKNTVIGLASLLLSASAADAQTTIYTQNFDAGTTLPGGWSVPNSGWVVSASNSSSGYTGASGLNNLDIANSGNTTGTYAVISSSVSTSSYTNVVVSWGARFTTNFPPSNLSPYLYYSLDNGATWDSTSYTEASSGSVWALNTVNLPVAVNNQASVMFKLKANITAGTQGTYRIDDFTVQATQVTTGINELTAEEIKVYAFNKTLFIQLQEKATGGELKIYSLNGVEVYGKSLNEQNHKIDLTALTQGVYVVKIQNGNALTTKKIMID